MLHVVYTNIDQFINKRDDLCMMIAGKEPDIILLTEVIPKAQTNPLTTTTLSLPNYNMYLNFDPGSLNLGRSGCRGICIFVRSKWPATEVVFPSCPFREHLWISIPLQGSDQLLVGCIYRSPSASPNPSTENLVELLKTVTHRSYSHILVAGDINIPQIDWTASFSYAPDGHHSHKFIEGIQECGLTQHVTRATRYRKGERPSTLDIILTNEEGLVQNLDYLPPIGNSDHIVLEFDLVCYAQMGKSHKVRLNFSKGKFQLLNDLIEQTSWAAVEDPWDPHQCYEAFKVILGDLVSSCIPRACQKRNRHNIYINKEAIRLKRKKRKLWGEYIHTDDEICYARYVRCKNDLRGLTRTLRKDFEQRLVANIKDNPKGFWCYARSRMKCKTGVENLRTESGGLTQRDCEKAEVLNTFFRSVCSREDDQEVISSANAYAGHIVCDVDITPSLVKAKLSTLRCSSAAGPDDIHPRVLHETAHTIAPLLSSIFRKSLDTGCLPHDWKLADVVPIYKNGGRDDPGNYRPVSLTSVPCKVLESIIRDTLMTHLQTEGLLADAQHGFRPGRSCATQLLLAYEEWSGMIEKGEPVDVLYLDLAKAFNTVPTRKLLNKVKAHGIDGKILRWIEAFLVGRQQRVIVGGSHSGWGPLTSGVPQGSVLAPLLFLLYVNDLPDVLNSRIKIFADDSKLYRSVSVPADSFAMQVDLDAALQWADEWQLTFNANKCKVLHIGRLNRHHVYTMKGTELEETAVERDLGIHMDAELKFRQQAAAAVSKASQVMAVIRRSFQLLDRTTLPMLFKTLVRPHLEYGNIVWGPFNRTDQKRIERVQRRATKLVPELRNLPYQRRLQELHLPSLYYRRRRGDMIAVYQVLHGRLDLDPQIFFDTAIARDTRGHPWRLVKPRAVSRIRRNAFSVRVVNDWNSLPSAVVTSDTLNQFKNRLDAHWTRIAFTIPHADC